LYFRFGYYTGYFTKFFSWYSNSTTQMGYLSVNADKKVVIYTGTGAGTLVATGSIALTLSNWTLIEVYVKIADSPNGIITVKIDGVTDASFTGGDTKPGADTTIERFYLNYVQNNSTAYFDDIAVNDTSGGADNSWCGDGKVLLLKPNGNGSYIGFTNSAGSCLNNYTYVDEIPADGDTSYVQSSTSGCMDTYAIEDHAETTPKTIKRVWVEGRAKNIVAAGSQFQFATKAGSTIYYSGSITPAAGYTESLRGTVYTTNPDTGIAWTDTDLDNLEIGIKFV
jgi:hypothetical protein